MFSAPNTTTMMNTVPAGERGAASGMRATFMNSGFVLSIGLFFTLMIVGLAARLPAAMQSGPHGPGGPGRHRAHGRRPAGGRHPVRRLPRRTTRCDNCSGPTSSTRSAASHAAIVTVEVVLPVAAVGAVPRRPRDRVRRCPPCLCAAAAACSWWAGDCREGEAPGGPDAGAGDLAGVDGLQAALPDVVEV